MKLPLPPALFFEILERGFGTPSECNRHRRNVAAKIARALGNRELRDYARSIAVGVRFNSSTFPTKQRDIETLKKNGSIARIDMSAGFGWVEGLEQVLDAVRGTLKVLSIESEQRFCLVMPGPDDCGSTLEELYIQGSCSLLPRGVGPVVMPHTLRILSLRSVVIEIENWRIGALDLNACTALVSLTLSRIYANYVDFSECCALQTLRLDPGGGGEGEWMLSDLRPLQQLTKLRHLEVVVASGAHDLDLTPLSGLTQLEHLALSCETVVDLTPLASLTSLRSLDVSNTAARDMASLSGLTRLNTVKMPRSS